MFRLAILLGSLFIGAKAIDYGSDELLKAANQRISQEFLMTNPFWTTIMIPVAVCLAVVLLIVSIFAVSLIAIKALNEPEPAFSTFAPPGFDALWERNVQAELGTNTRRASLLETIKEEDELKETALIEELKMKPSSNRYAEIPEIKLKKSMAMTRPNMPMEPPKPTLATNSKNGLEINQVS